jgi:class 3 adenylate cyclase
MSDFISAGTVTGNSNQIGHGNVINQGIPEPGPAQQPGGPAAHALYAFADIVSYSRLSARLQKVSQDYLVSLLDASLVEAGVRPDLVEPQDQGDARLLTFPGGTDATKVLAVLPRYLNDELLDRNQDMAPHAQLRVRLSLVMGVSARGGTGLAGAAPIAVVRLGNSTLFRRAMHAAPQAQCGVILDDYLYRQCVQQRFRPDVGPADYVPVPVSDPEKGFKADAWMRLFGYSSQQIASLIA